jgi:hypothetical protein
MGDSEAVFPFPNAALQPDQTFADTKLAALPVAVPLPPGHHVDPVRFTDEEALAVFFDRLANIGPALAEWAAAFVKAAAWWNGHSLHTPVYDVPPPFTDGLPVINPYRNRIFLPSSPLSASSTAGRELIRRLTHVKNDNIDRWFAEHPDVYQEYARRYEDLGQYNADNAGVHVPPPPGPQVVIPESLKDKTARVNIARAKTVTQLLLARASTSADGTPILVPGTLSPTFEDALQDTPSRALHSLLQYFTGLVLTKEGDLNIINTYKAKFPLGLITSAFAATYLNGYWATMPPQQEVTMVGQRLSLFTFAPMRTNTAEYQKQLEESTAIVGEDLVGTVNAHRTKASSQLFNKGAITSYQNLLATLANLLLVLEAADGPDQDGPSILVKGLEEFFVVLIRPQVRNWIEYFQRLPHGEHLPHSLAVDINNNCLIQMAQFATNANWGRAALDGTPIPASSLEGYQHLHAVVVNNWNKFSQASNLGPYLSPSSIWVSPKTAKESAKKVAKTTDTASPNSQQHRTTSSSQSTASRTSSSPGGPNSDIGMIVVPDNIRNGPQMPTGKRLCLLFSSKGRRCPNGYDCPNAHVTLTKASIPELQAIERWVDNTPNVTWSSGRPHRLGTIPAPTPAPPPSATPVPQVSPQAAPAAPRHSSATPQG